MHAAGLNIPQQQQRGQAARVRICQVVGTPHLRLGLPMLHVVGQNEDGGKALGTQSLQELPVDWIALQRWLLQKEHNSPFQNFEIAR